MKKSNDIRSEERVVSTMIQLARAAQSHRVIVAGSNSSDVFVELHGRGYLHATTTKTSRYPCGQYDVALVPWQEHSIKALEATLDWFVHFLKPTGVLVVWVSPHERTANQKLRVILARMGFRIESASRCENGVAIAARRMEAGPAAKVA
jgi:hypothetical protein